MDTNWLSLRGQLGGRRPRPWWMLALGLLALACQDSAAPHTAAEQPDAEAWDPAAYTAAMAECMREAGFAAELTTPSSAEYDLGEQPEEGRRAFDECDERMIATGVRPAPRPRTREDISNAYDRAHAHAECLEALGVDVPPPPSRESFIEHRGSNWILLGNVDQSEWQRIVRLQDECMG